MDSFTLISEVVAKLGLIIEEEMAAAEILTYLKAKQKELDPSPLQPVQIAKLIVHKYLLLIKFQTELNVEDPPDWQDPNVNRYTYFFSEFQYKFEVFYHILEENFIQVLMKRGKSGERRIAYDCFIITEFPQVLNSLRETEEDEKIIRSIVGGFRERMNKLWIYIATDTKTPISSSSLTPIESDREENLAVVAEFLANEQL